MENKKDYDIDDEIIKAYLQVYVDAMEAKKDDKVIDIIQNRMMYLVKRKQLIK
tara:strand:+ start:340 stop:498 length:159 start_codon:yes stop_codon:yes gene_type:complete